MAWPGALSVTFRKRMLCRCQGACSATAHLRPAACLALRLTCRQRCGASAGSAWYRLVACRCTMLNNRILLSGRPTWRTAAACRRTWPPWPRKHAPHPCACTGTAPEATHMLRPLGVLHSSCRFYRQMAAMCASCSRVWGLSKLCACGLQLWHQRALQAGPITAGGRARAVAGAAPLLLRPHADGGGAARHGLLCAPGALRLAAEPHGACMRPHASGDGSLLQLLPCAKLGIHS
jgi:hypothetical protein